MDKINVGIGDYAVAAEEGVLATVLGSCVGVILYDKLRRIGGLAHVYLPDSRQGKSFDPQGGDTPFDRSLKYADLLVPRVVEEMAALGASPKRLVAYLVGGAMLFDFPKDSSLNVGLRNLEKVKTALRELGLWALEVKVGGSRGRKVNFDVATGDLLVLDLPSQAPSPA
jgi:chemotaxis protein CheD